MQKNLTSCARVFAVVLVVVFASAQMIAGSLRLACRVDSRLLSPVRVEAGRILLADGEREVAVSDPARWQIEGDLKENAALLLLSPEYGISSAWSGFDKPDQTPSRAYYGRPMIWHDHGKAQDGSSYAGPFLQTWPQGTTGDALIVMVWMVKGEATQVLVYPIPASSEQSFQVISRFKLTPEERHGQPVLLLWQDGAFVPTEPRLGNDPRAQAAMVATIFDDADTISVLLKQGVDLWNMRTPDRFTLAHIAAEADSVHVLELLLRAAPQLATLYGGDSSKIPPLQWAVVNGRAGAAKQLVAAGADMDVPLNSRGEIPTLLAVARGHYETLSVLLAAGARVEAHGRFPITALDYAVMAGDCAMVELLYDGAGIDYGTFKGLQNGDVLRYLLRRKHYDTIIWMLDHGFKIIPPANTRGLSASNSDDLYSAAVLPYSVSSAGTVLRAMLAMLPQQDEERMDDLLVQACSELIAVERGRQNAVTRYGRHSWFDASPLAEAALAGRLVLMRKLIAAGCAINEPFYRGRSALHYAAAGNATEAASFLIEHGAAIDVVDVEGLSPLDVALANGSIETARLLAGKGAQLKPEALYAETLLIEAMRLDLPEIVIPAVRMGVAVDTTTFRSWSVRYIAEMLGARSCLAELERDDELGQQDGGGVTIIDLGELGQSSEMEGRVALRSCANPLEYRPPYVVRIKALVDPDGAVRICVPLDAGAPHALRKTAMDSVLRSKFALPRAEEPLAAAWVLVPVFFEAVEAPAGMDTFASGLSAARVAPRVVYRQPPQFPSIEKMTNQEGMVRLAFVVGKDGSVDLDDIDVIWATTRNFGVEATKSVSTWLFRPGMHDGEAVRTGVSIPIAFELSGER